MLNKITDTIFSMPVDFTKLSAQIKQVATKFAKTIGENNHLLSPIDVKETLTNPINGEAISLKLHRPAPQSFAPTGYFSHGQITQNDFQRNYSVLK